MNIAGLCLAGLSALWAGTVMADVTASDLIDYCQEHSTTPAQRIACLENALHIAIPAGQRASSGQARPRASQRQEAPAQNTGEDGASTANSDSGGSNDYYASPSLPHGIGAEQVPLEGKARQQARREYMTSDESTVVDFALNARGKLVLVLNNGQVWKQRGGDVKKVKLSEGETPRVRIKRGAISGYRMDFIDKDRTITVSRVK